MDQPIVVGLGELLWDCFADTRRAGGAPANVAFHAGQLGCRGIVCSRVGRDPLGDELLRFLAAQGLATDWVQRDDVYPTGTVTVDTSRADHPVFTIHENVAWDHLKATPEWEELTGRAAAVCFGTLAQRWPDARRAIHESLDAVPPGCLVVYDVNLRQHFFQRPWIEQSLAKSRIAKLNADEAGVLAQLLETGTRDHVSFARVIQDRYGVETICITRAEQGCLLVSGGETVDSPGVRVEVVDAVGAGDAFTAALIVGQLGGRSLKRQAALANQVGAMVASRAGAMPDLREPFRRSLSQG